MLGETPEEPTTPTTPETPTTGIGGATPDVLPETGAAIPLALIAMIAGIVAVVTALGMGIRNLVSHKL